MQDSWLKSWIEYWKKHETRNPKIKCRCPACGKISNKNNGVV